MSSDKQEDNQQGFVPQFSGQRPSEEVLMVFRRHPIVMRKGFYMLLIPFLISSIPVLIWPEEIKLLFVALAGLLLGLLLFFYHWIGWYFTIYILTNERLRQVIQEGLFGKSVIDLGLNKIQNISYNVEGFSAAMFGFGTIVIQTYVGDLVLDRLHYPGHIYDKLQQAVQEAVHLEGSI
jgi:uncharacterized membrane protein YdbT with pleckstrin-like domain